MLLPRFGFFFSLPPSLSDGSINFGVPSTGEALRTSLLVCRHATAEVLEGILEGVELWGHFEAEKNGMVEERCDLQCQSFAVQLGFQVLSSCEGKGGSL